MSDDENSRGLERERDNAEDESNKRARDDSAADHTSQPHSDTAEGSPQTVTPQPVIDVSEGSPQTASPQPVIDVSEGSLQTAALIMLQDDNEVHDTMNSTSTLRVRDHQDAARLLSTNQISETTAAKAGNGGLECGACCTDDQVQAVDMIQCDAGQHKFCRKCVVAWVRSNLSSDLANQSCLDEDCKSEYGAETLELILPPDMLALYKRRIEEERERLSGTAHNLVTCPLCSHTTDVLHRHSRLFFCPRCFLTTCRICRTLKHETQPCDHLMIVKSLEAYVERRVTESIIRRCTVCERPYVKVEACNKVKCVCGVYHCYVCRQQVDSYSHFTDNQRCNLATSETLHRQEMISAAREAVADFVELNVDALEVALAYDPIDFINRLSHTENSSDALFKLGEDDEDEEALDEDDEDEEEFLDYAFDFDFL